MGCSCDKTNVVDDQNNNNINQGISNYKIIKKIGKGATCTVIKLEKCGRFFAQKKIRKKNNDISLYENEISILKMFNHENIVKFIESQESDDCLEIIMEFGGDSNLKKFIKKKRKNPFLISQDIISKIIIQICFGLKEIHNKKIIHRDLTPQNIFIDETDENNYKIKIGDFGISTKEKYSTEKIDKKEYLPPEMLKGEEYNNKIDIYALGCIMYELFTLNVYYINKNIDNYVKKIDFDVYKKKWQYLTASLLDNDYNKRPDISKVVGQIDKYLYKTKEN
jgi:NIMA (never in mitosis gene a)-related kinase